MISSFFMAVILVFSPAVAFAADVPYPVRWTSEINITSLAQIPQLLNDKNYVGSQVNYVDLVGNNVTAETCNQYFELTKKGYSPENNIEIAAESFFKKNCDSLLVLKHAEPAKYSFIRDFNIQKDYRLLPAALVFPNLEEGPEPTGDLKTAFPDIRVESNSAISPTNSITLTSKSAGERAIVSVMAWGDLNYDGYDDMLLFVANYALEGSYHAYSLYKVTRKSKDAVIEEID